MTALLVEGGRPLEGTVAVAGNKNAALPLLAACLLTGERCELENMPAIRDAEALAAMVRELGAEVEGLGTATVRVRAGDPLGERPDPALAGRLRGSLLLVAPILARRGRVVLPDPGGDFPARRAMDVHLAALEALGAARDGRTLEAPGGLRGASFYLKEASVTGTETAVLAAAGASGESEIRNAACEPHVVELCGFLARMGVEIRGAGTPTIRIAGQARPRGARWRLAGDMVEAGSWAVLAGVAGGALEIRGARPLDFEPIANVLGRMGMELSVESDRILAAPGRLRGLRRVVTAPWPGFPTDMVSLVTVLATRASGATLLHDWMYELRLFALEQLRAMGADLFVCDPHRMIVNGPAALRGTRLDARDIRSGMALVAAALAASGASRIEPFETVERGYADLPRKLAALGAAVEVAA